ncbi:MAG: sugar phosphate nucleotidyltransferase [Candidatus Omnitrophica bacterium]|nr:sugar phosphate nucleotidyltransferase [Candidatus Omnitrophota bacterium]MCM8790618.1 sugar phosphate nucleotidyltransferase [Candidatus Omnitrophota bacterium]
MHTEEVKKLLIGPYTSVKIAMKTLSSVLTKVIFVVDDSDRLIGSVTDGDIRRAILSNVGFDRPIKDIMFKSPRFVRRGDADFREKIRRYIREEHLSAVPVVNEAGKILDIEVWYDFFDKHPHEQLVPHSMSNPVVIMAGGKGERLDPFTKILPKPLIPFGDKPILEKIMDNFNKYGFYNFILTLNYKKELIKMYLKENQLPYKVDWVEEDEYLGTAGSLGLLRNRIKETFFVCNCDILLDNEFKNILLWHKGEKAQITIIGCHKEMSIPYGMLEIENGDLKAINEKPVFDLIINVGVYIMEPGVMGLIGDRERIDMNHLIERAIKKSLKVSVYPVYGGWVDIGQWKEYQDSLYLLQKGV